LVIGSEGVSGLGLRVERGNKGNIREGIGCPLGPRSTDSN